ncbi:MAG: hypothetical protein A2W31_02675 [Planctomycetes bacterium RBG_16_64_10]|nr:MAG: hypothetical protein A2W31_02675 [Planctomycetes bacterium RBG_16_64_10]
MTNLVPGKKKQSVSGPTVERDWHPLARLRNEFETLLDRYWSQWQKLSEEFLGGGRSWGVQVHDEQGHVAVQVDAPGFEAEDFDLQIRGNQLVVTAERRDETQAEDRMTWRHGQLRRVIPLPTGIDVNQVEARYHSGVLEIRLAKGEDAKRKRITIQHG